MGLLVSAEYINKTEGYRFADDGIYESFTDDKGELYRSLVSEHGRCTGKIWIDLKGGGRKHIGWVFLKRSKYDDCDKTFLMETWATVHEKHPNIMVEHHYANLSGC